MNNLFDYKKYPLYNWQYKNTFFLVVSLVLLYLFAGTDYIRNIVDTVGSLGYIGAFVAGLLFVSTFTVAPAIILLYNLADTLNPLAIAVIAGFGALLGDYIIYKFVKNNLLKELETLFNKIPGSYLFKIFKTPYFAWLTPLIGMAIIASPAPDELGVGILSISKIRGWQFMILSLILNALGIFIVVTVARSF